MTQFPDLFAALAAPFTSHEVKARSQAGRQLHYISARTAQNRLDAVVGPENWWCEFHPWSDRGVLCKLSIRLPDGNILTKADIGGYADMQDAGDGEKAGTSDAFKRAAVLFGVGRYLYRDGVPDFVRERNLGPASQEARPEPAPASQDDRREAPWEGQDQPQRSQGGGQNYDGPPRSGRALFAWVKEQEQKHEVSLLKYLNNWGKLHEFPGRMIDWDADQVAQAHGEATRKLRAMLPDREEMAHPPGPSQPAAAAPAPQETPASFDPLDARMKLTAKVEELTRVIHGLAPNSSYTQPQLDSTFALLDGMVPEDLRVKDWDAVKHRPPFILYFSAAVQALKNQETMAQLGI